MGSRKNKKVDDLDREPTIHEQLMQPIFAEPLRKVGITAEYLAKKLKEELEAKETKFFQKDGVVKQTREVIAWGVRQRARESANELRGDFPAKRVEAKHEVEGIIVHEISPVKKPKESGR